MSISVDLLGLIDSAATFSRTLQPGAIVYLEGPLGAGKTTFVQALLASKGYEGAIKSPTYTLVESYAIAELTVHHFDLYRLKDPSELEFIGLRDYLNEDAICLFEWPDKGLGYLPAANWRIGLAYDADRRLLSIDQVSNLLA